jgi:hypothetical protein
VLDVYPQEVEMGILNNTEIPGGRRKGKPIKRWLDVMEDDLRKTGIKRWRIKAMDRTEWRKI